MKTATPFFLLLACLAWVQPVCRAQEQITQRDANEISYQARAAVQSLEGLLNFVTFSENPPSELKEVISNSYTPSRIQLFYNKGIIVEDDSDPEAGPGKARDIPVEKYLNTLDVFYQKTIDASVHFANIRLSKVKKQDYLYVKVYFERSFQSRHKEKTVPYNAQPREALVRLEKQDNKWKAYIVGVDFYDPSRPFDSPDNDIAVVTDSSGNFSLVSQEAYERERENYIQAKEAEDKRREAAYRESIALANGLYAGKEYKAAKRAYEEAQKYKEFTPEANVRLTILDKLLSDKEAFDKYRQAGDEARRERRYDEAITNYRKLIEVRPEMQSQLAPAIDSLTARIAEMSSARNKLESGKTEAAIEELSKLIRQKEKSKTESGYPELYLLRGKAYWEIVATDKKALDRALEDLNAAVSFDGKYIAARLARAEFLERVKSNYIAAVSDYDVVTAMVRPEKRPEYFAIKATLKEKDNNLKGAVEDYSRAIELDPLPAYYHQRGLLQNRLADWQAALGSFDAAIAGDAAHPNAYFHSALASFALEQYTDAAKRFRKAQALKLDSASVGVIGSRSNELFTRGETALAARDYDKAFKFYTNAVLIWPGNAAALYKKGETFFETKDYANAIQLYNAALRQRKAYPEACYKRGVAQQHLEDYQASLESFDLALAHRPDYAEAHLARGNSNRIVENYKVAVADYGKAIALMQASADKAQKASSTPADKAAAKSLEKAIAGPYFYLGQSHYALREYVPAVASLDAALKKDGDHPDAYHYRGLAYEAQHAYKDAIRNQEEALKRAAQNYFYHYAKGSAHAKNRDYAEAAKSFSYVLGYDSAGVMRDARYRRGVAYYRLGNFGDAETDFAAYEKSAPPALAPDFLADFGFLYATTGKDSLAAHYFEKSVSSGNHPRGLLGLGCVYSKKNQLDQALVWLEKALATRLVDKSEVGEAEDKFLMNLKANKPARKKFEALKKTYLAQK